MPARSPSVVVVLLCLVLGVVGAGSAGASAPRHARAWPVRFDSPRQFDLTEAQATFAVGPRHHPRVTASVASPVGFDYVASAVLRHPSSGTARVLVVAVNHRLRGSLAPDVFLPVKMDLRLSRRVRAPRLGEAANALSTSGPGSSALCDAQPQGALAPGYLRVLASAGEPPAGYDAAQTVAQGFDVACGRPSDPAFRAAVAGSPSGGPPPGGGPPPPGGPPPYRCPPPCGGPPRAQTTAYACPEAARPAYACPAPASPAGP